MISCSRFCWQRDISLVGAPYRTAAGVCPPPVAVASASTRGAPGDVVTAPRTPHRGAARDSWCGVCEAARAPPPAPPCRCAP